MMFVNYRISFVMDLWIWLRSGTVGEGVGVGGVGAKAGMGR